MDEKETPEEFFINRIRRLMNASKCMGGFCGGQRVFNKSLCSICVEELDNIKDNETDTETDTKNEKRKILKKIKKIVKNR